MKASSPQNTTIAVGEVNWGFDMDNVETNLLVIKNEVTDATKDCLRPFEMAQELGLDREVFDFLKSQLSPKGQEYMTQYRRDLLE